MTREERDVFAAARDVAERDVNEERGAGRDPGQDAGNGTVQQGPGGKGRPDRELGESGEPGEPGELGVLGLIGGAGRSGGSGGSGGGSGGGPFGGGSFGGGDGDGDEPAGLGADELALRRLLQGAVKEIQPGDAALEKLRHAVPARRARKRQALVGVAAAALLVGTAIPAFVHVAASGGDSDARPSIVGAGSNQPTQGSSSGQGKDRDEPGTDKKDDKSKGKKDKKDKKDKEGKGKEGKGKDDKPGATAGTDPGSEDTAAASSPSCDASQLGNATASVGTAEADGKVYGTFRIANVSGDSCTVTSAGSVAAAAQGAADPANVNVVDHTAGDAATGLPDPAQESSSLVLQPGASYEVRFAWVPAATCPSDGGDPSPNPSPSEGGAGGGTGGSESGAPDGTKTQLVREDGGTVDGSVAVTLTAEPGSPSTATTVANACSGTIYKTGVLAAQ
ncbi:hypothetical protein ABT390_13055 [Streptomyces aurantiacus]|uniref:DUF4232 domain-containing protein n=1 Tax=Streptomyces aurantiacus JA 4570 TaxID=1286094 RepID=S3ZU55_9ACTN|nr:hypothetical protein [Streptomyces aurantiacus]EPH46309.1 hypothetical protein STRAU_0559 [Streptomyces aurantiacus JA 4570]